MNNNIGISLDIDSVLKLFDRKENYVWTMPHYFHLFLSLRQLGASFYKWHFLLSRHVQSSLVANKEV